MKIQSGENLEVNNVNGKFFFDRPTGKSKIQLMEPFFRTYHLSNYLHNL